MDAISGKKILFLITKSNWGGAQAYVFSLANRMQEAGAEVAVALGGTGLPGAGTGRLAERLRAQRIRVTVLSSLARDISLLREFSAFFELLRILRRERPDVLHLNSSKAGGLGALAGRIAGTPRIIFTAHGWAHREPRPFLSRALIWLASWATIWLSHRVIVVSGLDYRASPVFLSRKKIRLVRNGIGDFPLLPRGEARTALAERCPSLPSEGKTWLLMQAELHRNKGIDTAIEAFARIHAVYPETALIVLGEGEERPRLEKRILKLGRSDDVFLAGFIPDSRRFLLAGDLMLIASRKEGLPLMLLEAGIARLPVVATSVGGIPEVITDHESGLLVPSGDPDALAAAGLELLRDTDLGQRLGEHLHARVMRDFSEERMAFETLETYTG